MAALYSDQLRAELIKRGHDGVIFTRKDGTKELVAFHPSQIKSAIGNSGDFDPSNPDIRYSKSRAAAAVDAALDGKRQKIGDWIAGKWDDLTPAMLGTLTLRHLADIGGRLLPGIRDYLNTVHQMSAARNEKAEAAGKFSRQVHEWARKNGAMANKLFDLMHEATIAGVDPSMPFVRLDMKQAKAAIGRHREQLANATTARPVRPATGRRFTEVPH